MQVLKNSKVTFVSAVGLCLLTNFWIISSFLTAPGLTVLLLKEKKSLLLILNLQASFAGLPRSCRQRGAGLQFFFFPVVPQEWGLSLPYSNHRCPVSRPCPQTTVWPELSTLCICSRPAPIIHPLVQPFD